MAETMGERRSADRVAGGEAQPLDHLSLRGRAQDLALTVGEMTRTFADLEHRVGETAARLLELGLNPGDRVCSWMAKTELACVLPLATARAGMIHVPINPVLRRAQTAHILADSGARLLIANRARLDTLPLVDRRGLPAPIRSGSGGPRGAHLHFRVHGQAEGRDAQPCQPLVRRAQRCRVS